MDLGAYAQIEDLYEVAKKNGIEVPRLRGYRLMKDESPISSEDLKEMLKRCEVDALEKLVAAEPPWTVNSDCFYSCAKTDRRKQFYLLQKKENGYKRYVAIRWDRLHGKKRKAAKFAIKKYKRRVLDKWKMWNKYAGKENILYIHARLGSWCWYPLGRNEVKQQPWFLEMVDDDFDRSYCDIYAKIDNKTSKLEKWIEAYGEQWHDFAYENPPIVGDYYRVMVDYNIPIDEKVRWDGHDFILRIGRPITHEVIGWK